MTCGRGRARLALLAVCGAAALAAAPLGPRPEGPPPAHTGGFGEPTCQRCHYDGQPLGAGDGELVIGGIPDRFEPGRTYQITVTLSRPAMVRGGFELAARFAPHEPLAALQAGTLSPADPSRTAITRDSTTRVEYAHHLEPGTHPLRPGELRWWVRWTAPAERQGVVFHAAAVAGNDDNSNLGDEVYARALMVPAR